MKRNAWCAVGAAILTTTIVVVFGGILFLVVVLCKTYIALRLAVGVVMYAGGLLFCLKIWAVFNAHCKHYWITRGAVESDKELEKTNAKK